MTDCSDKSPKRGPAAKPQEKVFLTSIMPQLFCSSGTNTLCYPVELKCDPDRQGASGKQSQSDRFSSTCELTVPVIARKITLPIAEECIKSEPQLSRFIETILSRIVVGDLEYQVINGDGNGANNIRGLFFRPAEPSKESDRCSDPHYKLTCERTDENLVEFCLKALAKYRRPCPDGAEREPTHIILPAGSWAQLMSQKKQSDGHPLAGDLDKLWNLKILASDFVPEGRGLILAIDDMALVLADGLDWEFGQWLGPFKGYSGISVTHKANLLIKYPRSIMLLDGLEVSKGTERSQEEQELLERPVVESTLPCIEELLSLRKMLLNSSRNILRHSETDNMGWLDLNAVCGNNANKVKDELQSWYERIEKIDCLVENSGNKYRSAFIIAKCNRDRDTYVYNRLQHWLRKFPCGEFIFRGQSKMWPVTSSLYRPLLAIGRGSGLPSVERRVLTAARHIKLPHTPESEIFADLQHFGGMTNYIDFTTSLTIALCFACKDYPENDGQVFMIRGNKLSTKYPIGQIPDDGYDSNCEYTAVTMAVNDLNINRAVAQQNVFIRSSNGGIDSNKFIRVEDLSGRKIKDFMVLTIKAEEKRSIMGYLQREGSIEELTFFKDIIGIIERDKSFERRDPTNEETLLKLEQYDNMEREMRRHRAFAQKMSANDSIVLPQESPHYYIGHILYSRGCYEQAVEEFLLAEPRYKSQMAPIYLHFFLASAYVRLGKYQLALDQLTNVKREDRGHLYHFIAADAQFWLEDYNEAWHNIKKAVTMNQTSITYLRLKILVADKFNRTRELESCISQYLRLCAYDPEITELKNKLGRFEHKRR